MIKTYNIEVDCPNCANKMEAAAAKVSGVKSVSIAFMTLKITVEFCDGADEKAVMKDVLKACRRIDSDCEIQL
ncbi:MAG: heavy-metal-associated domain-containing protein [Ruminococcaceae bacterium]|nr:heavy-metal-associated domain-containing protein [Oscillospiraceae bacterium]